MNNSKMDKDNREADKSHSNSYGNNNKPQKETNSNPRFAKSNEESYDDLDSPKKISDPQSDNEEKILLCELSSPSKRAKNANQSFDLKRTKKDIEVKGEDPKTKRVKEEIEQLFDYINSQRDIGNKDFHNNQMFQAEINYSKAIDYLNNYTMQNIIQPNSELGINFEKDKKKVLKILKENLSMAQAKLGKFYQAIFTANEIITCYDSLAESTHRRLLSWYIKINEIEKAKKLAEEIKGKFPDQSVFIPYFEMLAKKEMEANFNGPNAKKVSFNNTPWIVGTIGVLSATIAIILMSTKST